MTDFLVFSLFFIFVSTSLDILLILMYSLNTTTVSSSPRRSEGMLGAGQRHAGVVSAFAYECDSDETKHLTFLLKFSFCIGSVLKGVFFPRHLHTLSVAVQWLNKDTH